MEHQPVPDYCGLPTEKLREVCPTAVYPDRNALPQETDEIALDRARRNRRLPPELIAKLEAASK